MNQKKPKKTKIASTFVLLITIAALISTVSLAAAASTTILEETFESETLSKWTGTTTTSGETVNTWSYRPYQGRYHGRFYSNGNSNLEKAYVYKNVNLDSVYVKAYYQILQGLPLDENNDRFYLLDLSAGNQDVAGIGIKRENGVEKWRMYVRDGSNWKIPNEESYPTIRMDSWYCIELYWEKDSYQGKIEVLINGQRVFQLTGLNTARYGNVDRINLGLADSIDNRNSMIIYADNIEIAGATPTQQPSIPEPPKPPEEPPEATPTEPPQNPPNQGNGGAVFGWGGYISNKQDVIPILNDLDSDGYNGIRYWARPSWLFGNSGHTLKLDVLDLLVEEADKRGIIVYIDCEHNYPPSAYINFGNRETWINDVIKIGLRYKDKTNVVLEPVNEYTGSDQISLYNWATARIRNAGITLPLLWNFWWNQKNARIQDPLNNYAIGRHLYGNSYNSYNPSTPMSLQYAVDRSGVANS
ncbi:hypothetical protein KAI12_04495, partial [Candidatus Bathyarchaeota archaeon]|nr:hypothetical protein [Candidatus Bathyarchaeota archaeon]